jgi:hypothetical protein
MYRLKKIKPYCILISLLLSFILLVAGRTSSDSPKFLTLPFTDSDVKLQQGWYYSGGGYHEGIDYIKGTIDQPSTWQAFYVRATVDGEAIYTKNAAGWGNYVRIKHIQGTDIYYTLYAHLASSPFPEGQWATVRRGDFIGVAGSTGSGSNGLLHLHFEFSRTLYGVGYRYDAYDLYQTRNYYPNPQPPHWPEYSSLGANHYWTTDPPSYPGYGHITGHVSLQGRSGNNSGARIFLDGTEIVSTGTDGKYWLYNVTSGPHSVRIERMSYLCTETQVSVSAGQTSTLPDVMLRVGDATGDGRVNIFDLVLVAQSYGTSPPRDLRADVNGDNRVNIFDLVWVAQNWQVWCPTPWSSASATLTSVSPTKIELHSLLRSDHSLTVEVWARGTKNLFAADVHLRFDPVRLKVVDAQTGFIDTLVTDSVAGAHS